MRYEGACSFSLSEAEDADGLLARMGRYAVSASSPDFEDAAALCGLDATPKRCAVAVSADSSAVGLIVGLSAAVAVVAGAVVLAVFLARRKAKRGESAALLNERSES